MARTSLKIVVLVAAAIPLGVMQAGAQFGSIFGDSPPRPPGAVPGGRQPPASPPPDAQPNYPPGPGYPAGPSGQSGQGDIQSQPLPPPPGAAIDPRAPAQAVQTPAGQTPLTGLPPGQRQPRGSPQPADTSPQPGDEVIAEPPAQKIANTRAVFSGLDKITGRIINFDAAIGETVQFGALQVTPRACYTRPPTEAANTDAFIEVDEVTLQGEVRRIFTGWMFAASPGLHGVEHPIYDVWLTDCKGAPQPVTAESNPPAPAPPQQQRPQQRPQQPAQRRATPPR
jgi:hypothetical protein